MATLTNGLKRGDTRPSTEGPAQHVHDNAGVLDTHLGLKDQTSGYVGRDANDDFTIPGIGNLKNISGDVSDVTITGDAFEIPVGENRVVVATGSVSAAIETYSEWDVTIEDGAYSGQELLLTVTATAIATHMFYGVSVRINVAGFELQIYSGLAEDGTSSKTVAALLVWNGTAWTVISQQVINRTNAISTGVDSFAVGVNTEASGEYSHAEGSGTTASGGGSHAEGYQTTASGSYSHAEGNGTTASGGYSHAEGLQTTASGGSSHAEGYGSTATATSSHAAGYQSVASMHSQYAQSGNRFAASGDAQHTTTTLMRNTTNATPTELTINGFSPTSTSRFLITTDKAYAMDIIICAAQSGMASTGMFRRQLLIKNDNETTALVGSVATIGTDQNKAGAWSVAITANNVSGAIKITVTGEAATNIRWVATVHATEVSYP